MIPNAAEVVRRRWTVAIALRVVGLLVAATCLMPVGSWLAEGIRDGDLLEMWYYGDRLVIAAVLLLAGAGVVLLAGRIARWVVPVRRHAECPACRHRVEGVLEPRCTECGLALTPEFLGESAPAGLPEHPAVVASRRADAIAAVLRLLGLLSLLWAMLRFAGFLLAAMLLLTGHTFDGYIELHAFWDAGVGGSLLLAAGLVLTFGAPRLARWCVGPGWTDGPSRPENPAPASPMEDRTPAATAPSTTP